MVELCRRFHVRRLELFGSAASGAFDPRRSDLDFLVEFELFANGDYSAAFFAFEEALAPLAHADADFAEPIAGYRSLVAFRNSFVHAYAEIDTRIV